MLTIAEKGCNFFCVETKKTLAIAEKGCLMLDGLIDFFPHFPSHSNSIPKFTLISYFNNSVSRFQKNAPKYS
jgi:hypothetical protein